MDRHNAQVAINAKTIRTSADPQRPADVSYVLAIFSPSFVARSGARVDQIEAARASCVRRVEDAMSARPC